MGLIRSLADRLQDGRRRRKAHVGDPHVYSADPLFGLNALKRYHFSRETILVSFHHGFKIVLHLRSPSARCTFIRGSLPGVYVPGRLFFRTFLSDHSAGLTSSRVLSALSFLHIWTNLSRGTSWIWFEEPLMLTERVSVSASLSPRTRMYGSL